MLHRRGEESLQQLAGRVDGKNHHWLTAIVAEEPILYRTAFERWKRPNQRLIHTRVILFLAKRDATQQILQLLAAAPAARGDESEHLPLLPVVIEPREQRANPQTQIGRHQAPFGVDGLDALGVCGLDCFREKLRFRFGVPSQLCHCSRFRNVARPATCRTVTHRLSMRETPSAGSTRDAVSGPSLPATSRRLSM